MWFYDFYKVDAVGQYLYSRMMKYVWHGQTFWLHPHRLLYWEEERIVIGSDLHLGKSGHFRKAGIGIPQQVYKEDLQRLFTALQHFKPRQFLIVGDLFHSEANKELDWFLRWRNDLLAIDFHLIKGNHDILSNHWYTTNNIQVSNVLQLAGIKFVHDPIIEPIAAKSKKTTLLESNSDLQNEATLLPAISGHLHPGVSISGIGRQTLRLPCFYFNQNQCILPAFSAFTGLYNIKPKRDEAVFAITPTNHAKGEQGMVIQL